jgi:hypothetical protein
MSILLDMKKYDEIPVHLNIKDAPEVEIQRIFGIGTG